MRANGPYTSRAVSSTAPPGQADAQKLAAGQQGVDFCSAWVMSPESKTGDAQRSISAYSQRASRLYGGRSQGMAFQRDWYSTGLSLLNVRKPSWP